MRTKVGEMLKAFPRRVNNGEVNTAIGLPFMPIPLLHFRNRRGALAALLHLLLLPLRLLRCLLAMVDEPHPETAQEERRPWMPPFDPSKPSVPISYPIMTLDALASRSYFDSFHFPFNKASLPLPSSAAGVLPARPRLLVCHDFKGGYQDDLWVQGGANPDTYAIRSSWELFAGLRSPPSEWRVVFRGDFGRKRRSLGSGKWFSAGMSGFR